MYRFRVNLRLQDLYPFLRISLPGGHTRNLDIPYITGTHLTVLPPCAWLCPSDRCHLPPNDLLIFADEMIRRTYGAGSVAVMFINIPTHTRN
jgi:hypothetical protein